MMTIVSYVKVKIEKKNMDDMLVSRKYKQSRLFSFVCLIRKEKKKKEKRKNHFKCKVRANEIIFDFKFRFNCPFQVSINL